MVLKRGRILNVKNRQFATRLRLREAFERIARLHRVAYRLDCHRGREAPFQERAQTDEVRGRGPSRTAR